MMPLMNAAPNPSKTTRSPAETTGETGSRRFALRLSFAAFALVAAAGGLLWLRFGEAMLVDSLALIRSCF